ncbi:MAG: hypothetical protein ABSD47_01420 [Candidatus Methylomirabilota bacterium]|jgi:hypothetical protein
MAIDPSSFHPVNVTDTCAVWNVLSSRTLYTAARLAGVVFVCTGFVVYECLFKPRKTETVSDKELQARLRAAQKEPSFVTYPLDVADLQTIGILESRKRLGKGELSSIAFALKIRQAFLTDDQKARRLAREIFGEVPTQTTPHLLGWLFFGNRLGDADKDAIVKEHAGLGRSLAQHFEEAYLEACRCRLMTRHRMNSA